MLSLEMEPGAPIALPEGGGSLPSLHLHPSGHFHNVPASNSSSTVIMDRSAPETFPWTRLPSHVQQRILSCAILPDGPDTALIVGNSDHSTHLRQIAVPVLLALGSWSGYCNAMRILYRSVHLDLSLCRRSSVIFLTSAHALRPRNMVVTLRMAFDIKKSLPLFDTGHTIRQSKGKLIKMNVPTALRCMKVHGRLSEIEFLVDSLAATAELGQRVPEDYLPMAEIQLVNRTVLEMWDDHVAPPSLGSRLDIRQAETVIAPAFLACRAWQSGFLPLFEDGTFPKGATFALMPKRDQNDQDRTGRDGIGNTLFRVDGSSLMRFWLGGTIMELLDETAQPSSWIDPFTLSTRGADHLNGAARSVQDRQGSPLPDEDTVVDSIEAENEVAASPAKASDSSSESASTNSKTGREEQHSATNLQKRRCDTRPGHSTSKNAPERSKGYSTPSDDGSLSDEVEMRKLHRRYGIGSKAGKDTSPISPSSSESLAHSAVISGTAISNSDSESEAC